MSSARSKPSTSGVKTSPNKKKESILQESDENVSVSGSEQDGDSGSNSGVTSNNEEEDGDKSETMNMLNEEEDEENGLSEKALEAYREAQNRAGVIYISRIPPGMSPDKVRHLMSAYGEIGKVFLQQENAKTAHLRAKHGSSKTPHYTEGWVEFRDKKIARAVADMLNAQPVGGKAGSRWREDVWTMRYLPRFKWYMLTEQIGKWPFSSPFPHEHATHAARLRMELAQSKREQRHYLKQVEIGKSLEKRKRKREKDGDTSVQDPKPFADSAVKSDSKRRKVEAKANDRKGHDRGSKGGVAVNDKRREGDLDKVLGSIF
ncbi:hypothetical protein M408DRAFT_26156 [Serendipita vermifera MAFF 305830]|uniref:18S rRNA factor 2 n=1 Tax=Serendipita vermifera MAFF 305830 TaxID=933852 RepID=A0A0C2WGW1_SERVB|nr:hypothetical protein M408DRAFT_26156 [Serendipita vermifera MAFF 305830]